MLTLALRSRDSGWSEAWEILSDKVFMPWMLQVSDSRYTRICCSLSVGKTSSTASCSSAITEKSVQLCTICQSALLCNAAHVGLYCVTSHTTGIWAHGAADSAKCMHMSLGSVERQVWNKFLRSFTFTPTINKGSLFKILLLSKSTEVLWEKCTKVSKVKVLLENWPLGLIYCIIIQSILDC